MRSFAVGLLCSAALSGFTLWAMMAGTVTMVDRSDTVSTRLDGIWEPMSPATMSVPLAAEGNLED